MKLTESQLKQIVAEELAAMVESGEIDEGFLDRMKARMAGAKSQAKGTAQSLAQKGLAGVARGAGKLGVQGAEKVAKGLDKAREKGEKASAKKVKAQRVQALLSRHLSDLENDLDKLDLGSEPKVAAALNRLQSAIASAMNRSLE